VLADSSVDVSDAPKTMPRTQRGVAVLRALGTSAWTRMFNEADARNARAAAAKGVAPQ
jgi:hypothetical protein